MSERLTSVEKMLKQDDRPPRRFLLRRVAHFFGRSVKDLKDFFLDYWVTIVVVATCVISVTFLICMLFLKFDAERAQRHNERQVLDGRCSSFCVNHGYYSQNRQGTTCFCSTSSSNDVVFIIDSRTSEHWVVEPEERTP